MVIPQPFTTASPRLINYDYTDELSGNSYITFYPTVANVTAGNIYYLSRRALDGYSSAVGAVGAVTQEYDFDSLFDVSAIVKGDALLNFTVLVGVGSTMVPTINIYHVAPDTTETLLGTASTATRTPGVYVRENIKIALTEKNFAVGDTLRITLSLVHTGGNTSVVYCDPTSPLSYVDAAGRTVGSDFIADIPFKNTN